MQALNVHLVQQDGEAVAADRGACVGPEHQGRERPSNRASIRPDATWRAEFAVVKFLKGWRILFDGRWCGRFDDEAHAVDAAIRLAGDVSRAGRSPHLLVQDPFGEMRARALAPASAPIPSEASQSAG